MLKRRRNAGLALNSTGERGSTVNRSAATSSNSASARMGNTLNNFWRKACKNCKGAVGGVIPPNHRQLANLSKDVSGNASLSSKLQYCSDLEKELQWNPNGLVSL